MSAYALGMAPAYADQGRSTASLHSAINADTEGQLRSPAVFQRGDVQPSDWAYQALLELNQRYDCLEGSAEVNSQSDRHLSRDGFATELNACLQAIEGLIAANNVVLPEVDREFLQQLRQGFEFELTVLNSPIEIRESPVDVINEHPSSATESLEQADSALSTVATTPPEPLLSTTILAQSTNVFQLSDVDSNDWAYRALTELNQRYDCLKGYPDGSFRGDRVLSRYEFAAGLNACLQAVERLVAETAANLSEVDMETLQQLMQSFETELAVLNSRVEQLDSRLNFLDDNQFSTTTKLFGQVVVGFQGRLPSSSDFLDNAGVLGRDGIRESDDPVEANLGYNAQITLLTQFNQRSVLLTGMQAGNLSTDDTNTFFGFNNDFTKLGYESDTNNSLIISDLNLRQLVTDNLALIVGPAGVNPVNVFRGPSRVESAGFGPLSRFAQRNPIIQLGATTAGIGFDWQVAPRLSVQGVYSAFAASTAGEGLFGAYTAGIQAFITPTNDVDLALYYLKGYSFPDGIFGLGDLQTGVGDSLVSANSGSRLNTDAFGATANWAITDGIRLGGWVGFTTSDLVTFEGIVQTSNWMVSLEFPDLGAEGNYGAIFFGQPPKITGSNLRANGALAGNIPSFFEGNNGTTNEERRDTTYHLEGFYRFRLNDNIAITPGLIFLFNPGHNANNETISIGAIRTTFSF
ncbi:MAG: iron uptake porin [Spirulinaceae cyanobacterium]